MKQMIWLAFLSFLIVYLGVKTTIAAGEQENYYLKGERTANVIAGLRSGIPTRITSVEIGLINTAGGEIKKQVTSIVTAYFKPN